MAIKFPGLNPSWSLYDLFFDNWFSSWISIKQSINQSINQSQLVRFACVCNKISDLNNRNLHLTCTDTDIKMFLDFKKNYNRYKDLIQKYDCKLRILIRKGMSQPTFYGNITFKAYQWKKWFGKSHYSVKQSYPQRVQVVAKTLKLVIVGTDINKLISSIHKY